jgi:hypothetical protein
MKHAVRVGRILALAAVIGLLGLSLSGCADAGAGGGSGSLEIVAEVDSSSASATESAVVVVVTEGNNLVDTATVTVNGQTMSFLFFLYGGSIPKVDAGDSVNLAVTYNGTTASATVTMPTAPSISAPSSGSSHDASSDISVSWSVSPEDAEQYVLSAGDVDNTTAGEEYTVSVTPPSGTIPGGTLKTGESGVSVSVVGANSIGISNATASSTLIAANGDVISVDTQ